MKFRVGDTVVATSKRYTGNNFPGDNYKGSCTFKSWLEVSPLSIGKIEKIEYHDSVKKAIIVINQLWFFEDELILIERKDEV